MMENQKLLQILQDRFGSKIVESKERWGELTVVVKTEAIVSVCQFLRDQAQLSYKFLSSITGVDLGLEAEPRFEVVYHLYSHAQNHYLRLKVRIEEDETVPSVIEVWPAADWYERETYDLFGIEFEGHPDLRRIMMPDDYEGHPLRKDFPLRGYTR